MFTIPVSVIATRQQLATKNLSFRQTFQAILHDDGITGLWRGLKPSLVLCVNPAITYGMFERFKVLLLKEGEKMTPGKAFIIGALSKTMATIVSCFFLLDISRRSDTEPDWVSIRSLTLTLWRKLDSKRNTTTETKLLWSIQTVDD